MGFFKSFQYELGRNTAKYVSNKILGEFGWATPRRHLITGEDRSNYTNAKSLFNSINAENTNSEISDEEIRQQNANYKEEYLSYLNSISTYHTIRSNDWIWTKGEKGNWNETDSEMAINGYCPGVFAPWFPVFGFENIRSDFVDFLKEEFSFLTIDLMGYMDLEIDIDTNTLLYDNDFRNEFSMLLFKYELYHIEHERRNRDELPDPADLSVLLKDFKDYLLKELEPSKGLFDRIFSSNNPDWLIQDKVEKLVNKVTKYCLDFIAECSKEGDFLSEIINQSITGLIWVETKSATGLGVVKEFFTLVSELGHFDRFNEEGLCLKFNDLIAGIVMFDLYIDPKIKVPENKIGTIYNDLKLKIEPLTNSESNEILHNMIASLMVSLGIEIKAMNVEKIESIGINVYLPNPNLEDQLCLRLLKEIDFFSNSNLSKMDASKLFSLFSDSELTVNYSRRSGFSEI